MENVSQNWTRKNYIKLWLNVSMCVPTFLVVETLAAHKWSLLTILGIVCMGSLIMGILCGVMGVLGYLSQQNFVTLIEAVFGKKQSKNFLSFKGIRLCRMVRN